jgi:phospholipid/cholesterol/gamma-HCH transport system ATP-binding protein
MSFFSLEHVSKSFGSLAALKDICFSCQKGERIGIVGPSGSGKSVLLKLIAGIFSPDSGTLTWQDGKVPQIGFLFQEGALFDSMTVEENVMFPLTATESRVAFDRDLSRGELLEKVKEMLGFVGLSKALEKYPSELSGGMRKRAGIARALIHAPELLLLDDPTSGLDPVTANTIMNLIERLTDERQCTFVMVSHDIRRLIPRVQRVCMLEKGEIIADCPSEHLLEEAPDSMINFLKTRYDFAHG